MRWIVCFFVAFVGCVASLPADHSVTADLAAETARMVVELRQQIPPSPPKPSDGRCKNCEGRGYVGDGRVKVTCQPCGGTGREPKSVVVQSKCADGKCQP